MLLDAHDETTHISMHRAEEVVLSHAIVIKQLNRQNEGRLDTRNTEKQERKKRKKRKKKKQKREVLDGH